MTKKIAFLYLDKTYSVYHTLGIAIALSKTENTIVTAFCNKRSVSLVEKILSAKENNVNVILVKPHWYFQMPVYVEIKIRMRDLYFLKYRSLLREYDVIVTTIYNDLSLKRVVSPDLKLVYAGHGVSNTEYSFDDKVKDFDLVLVPGKWECEKRKEKKQLNDNNCKVAGYPKLDVISQGTTGKLFDNDHPTVLYNPHWNKKYSSYFKFGTTILRFFQDHPEYNLIFSPHSLLKERHFFLSWELRRFRNLKNILIDLGSERANNMTYTKYADIYLGDYSSQALEFTLLKRRPCIFLNANYSAEKAISWQMGKVYEDISSNLLGLAIKDSETLFHERYKKEQDNVINKLFTLPENGSSSSAAASAITSFFRQADSQIIHDN